MKDVIVVIQTELAVNPVSRLEGPPRIDAVRKPDAAPELRKHAEEEKREYTQDELQEAVDRTNKLLSDNNITHLKFEIHKGTGSMMVKVVDNSTDEVIREIPSEKLLDYAAGMWELAGIIVDEKG